MTTLPSIRATSTLVNYWLKLISIKANLVLRDLSFSKPLSGFLSIRIGRQTGDAFRTIWEFASCPLGIAPKPSGGLSGRWQLVLEVMPLHITIWLGCISRTSG